MVSQEHNDTQNPNKDEEQIVTFTDEASKSAVELEPRIPEPDALRSFIEGSPIFHDIKEFLARPRNVATIQITAAHTPFTLLATFNVPDVILSSDMILCKCADYRWLSCIVHFRLLLNVNRFAQGCLIAQVEPVPSMSGINANLGSLTSISGYRCGYLDYGQQPVLEIKVPFVYTGMAYDMLHDGVRPWAALNIWVLNQLKSTTGSTSADLAVYCWATDVKLGIPTPQHIPPFPVSTFNVTGSNGATNTSMLNKTGNNTIWKGHSGTEADIQARTGVVTVAKKATSAFSALGEIAASVGRTIGNAASWVEAAGPTLAAAGFSKPATTTSTDVISQVPGRHWTNIDGADNSQMLAARSDNSLNIDPNMFGSNVDEMNITNFVSQYNFIETIQWPITAPPGAVLRSWPVTPGYSAELDALTVWPTQLGFMTAANKYWGGDINYMVQVICNQFYSGRLILVFLSGYTSVPNSVSFTDIEACPKEVRDIKETNVITQNVPWGMNNSWLNCVVASRTSTGTDFTYNDLCSEKVSQGMMALVVQSALVVPDQVPPEAGINIFIAGGSHIRFSVPNQQHYVRHYSALDLERAKKKQARANKDESLRLSLKDTLKGKSSNQVPDLMNVRRQANVAEHTMLKQSSNNHIINSLNTTGEVVTSIRQLIGMFSPIFEGSYVLNKAIEIDPAYYNWSVDTIDLCRMDVWSSVFAFARGGVRYKIVPLANPGTVIYTYTINLGTGDPPQDIDENATIATKNLGFIYLTNNIQTPFIEVALPYYSRKYLAVISDIYAIDRMAIRSTVLFGDPPEVTIYKASHDDTSFGYKIGCPALRRYA